jgi:hypothetical protein
MDNGTVNQTGGYAMGSVLRPGGNGTVGKYSNWGMKAVGQSGDRAAG